MRRTFVKMLKKNAFVITEEQEDSVKMMAKAIAESKDLSLPNFDKPLYLYTDASDMAVGGVKTQQKDEFPVAWVQRRLNLAERN